MKKKKQSFSALVVAAGKGSRMHADCPKQFMDLNGRPVLYYALHVFEESPIDEIVLVTGKDDIPYCQSEIVDKFGFHKVKQIIPGGKERFDSVYAGLQCVGTDYVLIHDGARPMLTQEIILRIMQELCQSENCIVGMPVKDTIKIADEQLYAISTPDRRSLWQIQTPQAFRTSRILAAYQKILSDTETLNTITDDAMVLEYAGEGPAKLIYGSYENIKITTAEDLVIAQTLLDNRRNIDNSFIENGNSSDNPLNC